MLDAITSHPCAGDLLPGPCSIDDGDERCDPGIATAVLRALASMARASKRQQAEMAAALHRSGLVLAAAAQASALRQLEDLSAIGGLIPLDDGGLLLSVTSSGMERATR